MEPILVTLKWLQFLQEVMRCNWKREVWQETLLAVLCCQSMAVVYRSWIEEVAMEYDFQTSSENLLNSMLGALCLLIQMNEARTLLSICLCLN